MKLLFVHGGEKLKEDTNGNLYTGSSYNQEVWDRYLSIFVNITVMFRREFIVYKQDFAKKKFHIFNKSQLNFIEVPDLSTSYKNFSVKKLMDSHHIIEKAVLEHDFLIARLPSNAGNIAIKYAKKHNKPYLVEVVGCPWDAYWHHSMKGKVVASFMWLKTKNAVKSAPFVYYVTNEFLQRRYPSKGKAIGCSDVALPNINNGILEKRFKKIQDMRNEKPIILGTTAVVNMRYKGHEFVIKAISQLNNNGYNFEYHLVGAGDYSFLKAIAEKYGVSDKVIFLGSLPHEKVFEYLDMIDIYVQPSMTEGLPRALIEAMSRGCPSIGSDAGGIPELLNETFIFRRGSTEDIFNLLKKISVKATLLNEAKRSFEKAKEFDKELLNNKRITFYKELRNCGENK
ncbi:glycosyltransferase [Paenibacillus sp. N4]|uniref:glycosyltransferase family 4 protein n=1 Tax=Paenibacillus vietnamensis TaxID=2590547 RepID=UPI001CD08F70|nr:glycosyltransferase [Paenibacillus vietnamensis]MCA0756494.1 glycosyltransferase [Paenibacillus vietnamensis]